MLEYNILDAREEHLEDLERLEKCCFTVPWTAEQLRSQLPDDRHVFIVAEFCGTVLGYVGMAWVIDEGYISNVAVDPEYRLIGLGSALIEELLRRCGALGLSFVTLEVRRGNAPAISLYQKHGFSVVGERKNYYEQPREDALLMTKFF